MVAMFLQKGITILTTPIFTRLMTTDEYGNFNVFNSWLEIVTIIVGLKLSAGMYTQGLVKFSDNRTVFSSALQGLSLTLTLVWTTIYWITKDFWNKLLDLTTVQMLAMLVMIWATAAFNFWAASQRVQYKYRLLVLVTVIVSILKPLIGVIFVINAEDKVTARILGLALVELVGYCAFFVIQIIQGKKFYSSDIWKYALTFCIPLVPHYLSTVVLNSSDRIMIKTLVDANAAGLYSLSYQLSQVVTLFTGAMFQAIDPWMYGKIKKKEIEDIAKVAYPALLVVSLVIVLIMFCAPEILLIFAPVEYQAAKWVVPPVIIGLFFSFLYTLFATFEFYYEKTRYISLATMLGAVLNIVLNYVFIQIFGFVAAGYTTLVCYMLYACAHYYFMRKVCKEFLDGRNAYDLKTLGIYTMIVFSFGVISLLTYESILIRYGLLVLLLIICVIKRKYLKGIITNILKVRKQGRTE